MEEGVLHRDLAARNVLLFSFDANDPLSTSVKVADFGLSIGSNCQSHVYGAADESKPVRYLPPEALQRGRYNKIPYICVYVCVCVKCVSVCKYNAYGLASDL